MNDLQRAKEGLKGHTLCLVRGEEILVRDERGIAPMMALLEEGYELTGFTAADRVLRDRHHWHDVAAGAAIGVLSTELCYFVSGRLFKDRGVSVAFSGRTVGVAFCIR